MKSLGKRIVLAMIFLLAAAYLLLNLNQVIKPQLVNTNGQTFEKAVVTEILRDNIQENGSRIGDQIVKLRLEDGSEADANCPNGLLFGTTCTPGMHVVAIRSKIGQLSNVTVYSFDRTYAVLGFLLFFCVLLSLVGGKKGVKSVIALALTFISFLFFFFPMILRGYSPVLSGVFTSCIVLSLTVYLVCGWTRKALAAGLGALGGVLSAGIAAEAFGSAAHLTGYNVSNIEQLMFVAQNTPIDVGALLFAGILFASLGAVLDISMDVSSAVSEIRQTGESKNPRALFHSGMRVGQDVMGTMAATLILAVFGGSLGTWVLDYVYDLPFLQLMNSNNLDIVIMQGLSGGIGVILTVPISAAAAAYLPSHHAIAPQPSPSSKEVLSHENHRKEAETAGTGA